MRRIYYVLSFIYLLSPGNAAAASGFTRFLNPDVSTHAQQIAVNPDDTILIAGSILTTDPVTHIGGYDTFVLKLREDGTPDARFGIAGWVRIRHLLKRKEVIEDGSIVPSALRDPPR